MPSNINYPSKMSHSEMDRRWALVRKEMKFCELDCIIVQAREDMLGGSYRYLTDLSGCGYGATCLLYLNGDMTLIGHGGAAEVCPGGNPYGVTDFYFRPLMPTFAATNTYAPEIAVKSIKEHGCQRVGYVGMALIDAFMSRFLERNLPDVMLTDASDILDYAKARKSRRKFCGYARSAIYTIF